MFFKSGVVPAVVLLAALIGSSCGGGGSTTAPSPQPPTAPAATPTPPTTPIVPKDFSQIVGTWNLDLRLAEVTAYGSPGCVSDTLRSQVGVSSAYTLTITETGAVTLKDRATNYSSSFTVSGDGTSFTDYGYFTSDILVVRCTNGAEHRLLPFAGGLAGRLSGEELSGTWGLAVLDLDNVSPDVEFTAKFTGKR